MISPAYFVILIIVGALLVAVTAFTALAASVLAWQTWALVRVNRSVGEKFAAAAPHLEKFATVATEIKTAQEGEFKVMEQTIRAIKSLERTVEEFQALLIPPSPASPAVARPRRSPDVIVASEADEMDAQSRSAERRAQIPDISVFGRNVATE